MALWVWGPEEHGKGVVSGGMDSGADDHHIGMFAGVVNPGDEGGPSLGCGIRFPRPPLRQDPGIRRMGRVVDGEDGIGDDGDGPGEQEAIVLTKRLVHSTELAPAFANFALPSGKIDIVGSRVKASAASIDGAVQASGEKLFGFLSVPPVGCAA